MDRKLVLFSIFKKGNTVKKGLLGLVHNMRQGLKNYKRTLPSSILQKNFWSIPVYDSQTYVLLHTDYALSNYVSLAPWFLADRAYAYI